MTKVWKMVGLIMKLATTAHTDPDAQSLWVKIGDMILDFFEKKAEKTKTEIDDMALAKIRDILGIPDGDD